jgi:RNA polymerase sigma factor (sigma-70 family)
VTSGDKFGGSGGSAGFPAERWQQVWSHREHLLKVAQRRSVTMQDAEDAVHEAMLRAAERTHIDGDRMGAWLTTVTVRLCVDRHRQLNRTDALTSSVQTASGEMSVEEALCDQAEAKWLAERCEDLPARQAEALDLQAQDLDLSQIAQQMGLSYRAVQSLLARGRKALRATLAATLAVAVWSWRGRPRAAWSVQTVTAASAALTLAVAGLSLPAHSETQQAPTIRLDANEAALPTVPDRHSKSPATPPEPAASRTAADTGAGLVPSARQQLSGQPWSAGPRLSDTGPAGPPGLPEATLPAVPALPEPALPEPALPALPVLPDVPAQALPTSPDDAPTLVPPGILPTPDTPLLQR